MLPIGVIIPTRNSAAMLPGHIAALREWIGSVQQVVVVDSFSNDGTVELLKDGLRHPHVEFLSHPPGLYQSWNFGIQQLKGKYTYVATVGDATTLAGLTHLLDSAERFGSDLVLSPPRFLTESGTVAEGKRWTLHHYLEAQQISAAAAIPRAHLFLASVLAGTAGMMGSSASNLYRTEVFQARPFPTEFGHIGDTAWGVANGLHVRTAVTAEPCASFVIHAGGGNFSREREDELGVKLLGLARDTLRNALQTKTIPPEAGAFEEIIGRYESLHRFGRDADRLYYDLRARRFPWFLRPTAWKARRERNRHRAALKALWRQALNDYRF